MVLLAENCFRLCLAFLTIATWRDCELAIFPTSCPRFLICTASINEPGGRPQFSSSELSCDNSGVTPSPDTEFGGVTWPSLFIASLAVLRPGSFLLTLTKSGFFFFFFYTRSSSVYEIASFNSLARCFFRYRSFFVSYKSWSSLVDRRPDFVGYNITDFTDLDISARLIYSFIKSCVYISLMRYSLARPSLLLQQQ